MRKSITKTTKAAIGDHCVNCGATDGLQYHHIVPLAFGGNDVPENMVCLCRDCHSLIHYGKRGVIAHNDAVKAGVHAAIERGVHFGKKTAVTEDKVRFIAEHSTQFAPCSTMTEPEIRDALGVGNTTYFKIKRTLMDAMNAAVWPYKWDKPRSCAYRPQYAHAIEARRAQ